MPRDIPKENPRVCLRNIPRLQILPRENFFQIPPRLFHNLSHSSVVAVHPLAAHLGDPAAAGGDELPPVPPHPPHHPVLAPAGGSRLLPALNLRLRCIYGLQIVVWFLCTAHLQNINNRIKQTRFSLLSCKLCQSKNCNMLQNMPKLNTVSTKELWFIS